MLASDIGLLMRYPSVRDRYLDMKTIVASRDTESAEHQAPCPDPQQASEAKFAQQQCGALRGALNATTVMEDRTMNQKHEPNEDNQQTSGGSAMKKTLTGRPNLTEQPKYEHLWRNKHLASEAKSIEDMICGLLGAAARLRSMKSNGVDLDSVEAKSIDEMISGLLDAAARLHTVIISLTSRNATPLTMAGPPRRTSKS
jgi:hypothetical protein